MSQRLSAVWGSCSVPGTGEGVHDRLSGRRGFCLQGAHRLLKVTSNSSTR